MPNETLATIKRHVAAIKGPLTTPVGEGIRSLNVAIRKQLDLYACVRPVKYISPVPSPMKHPEKIDMVVFRENAEDLSWGSNGNRAVARPWQSRPFLKKKWAFFCRIRLKSDQAE